MQHELAKLVDWLHALCLPTDDTYLRILLPLGAGLYFLVTYYLWNNWNTPKKRGSENQRGGSSNSSRSSRSDSAHGKKSRKEKPSITTARQKKTYWNDGIKTTVFENVAGRPLGSVCWDGAFLLRFFASSPAHFPGNWWRGKRVVDLGAGTGVLGIFLAQKGAIVELTDAQELVALMRDNINLNQPKYLRRLNKSSHPDGARKAPLDSDELLADLRAQEEMEKEGDGFSSSYSSDIHAKESDIKRSRRMPLSIKAKTLSWGPESNLMMSPSHRWYTQRNEMIRNSSITSSSSSSLEDFSAIHREGRSSTELVRRALGKHNNDSSSSSSSSLLVTSPGSTKERNVDVVVGADLLYVDEPTFKRLLFTLKSLCGGGSDSNHATGASSSSTVVLLAGVLRRPQELVYLEELRKWFDVEVLQQEIEILKQKIAECNVTIESKNRQREKEVKKASRKKDESSHAKEKASPAEKNKKPRRPLCLVKLSSPACYLYRLRQRNTSPDPETPLLLQEKRK